MRNKTLWARCIRRAASESRMETRREKRQTIGRLCADNEKAMCPRGHFQTPGSET